MEVVLNGETVNEMIDVESLGLLLDSMQGTFPKGHIVSYLFVDGQEVMQNSVQALREVDLTPVNEVRIQTSELRAELIGSIVELIQFVDEVVPSLEDAAFQVRLGNVGPAADTFSECFEGLGLALRNMEEIYSAMPRLGIAPNDDEIGLFTSLEKANLTTIIEHFTAQEWRVLGEMVRDDLVPIVRGWKSTFNNTAERFANLPNA